MLGGNILMKTFFKVTVLGLLMVVLTAVSVSPIMAQDDDQAEKTALYNKFIKHYDKETIDDKQAAIDAAKAYIAKFNTPEDKQYTDYFKEAIPPLEEWITNKKKKNKEDAERAARIARLKRLNTAYEAAKAKPNDAKNWDEYFAAGEDVLKFEPEFVDVSIVLASGGSEMPKELLTESKYKALTLMYANKVINQIESGVKSDGNKYGEFRWVYGSKDKALTWMNTIIGFIKAQDNKDAAMPYYYKATQYETGSKNWTVYRIIGQWYFDKLIKLGEEREKLDKTNEENFEPIKQMVAVEKGYAERAIDAYARAYDLARTDSKVDAKSKTALFESLQKLFAFRYSDPTEAEMKTDISINNYVASVSKKPMPNPETKVTPVKLKEDTPSNTPADAKKDETKTSDAKPAATKKVGEKTSDTKAGATRSRTVSKTATDN